MILGNVPSLSLTTHINLVKTPLNFEAENPIYICYLGKPALKSGKPEC